MKLTAVALALVATTPLLLAPARARAQAVGGEPSADATVDLGTVPVTGAAAAELPRLAVMSLVTRSDAETTLQLVVRGDLDRAGAWSVLADGDGAPGPLFADAPFDPAPWRAKGVSVVVRTTATALPGDRVELAAQAFFPARGKAPAFEHRVAVEIAATRTAAHRASDALLRALTGRAGGFASEMVFGARVGSGRQVFAIDADGFHLHAVSPEGATAVAPALGPGGEVFYGLSRDRSPFDLVRGPSATRVPLPWPGSVLGVAFSPDRARIAVAVASDATSVVYTGAPDLARLEPSSTALLATHPALGPGGHLAYVAGGQAGQRIYVDGKAISPPGYSAAAPAFCDGPDGLAVVYAVRVGRDSDLFRSDLRGGGLTRLTQGQGSNAYPACSPDGRLLAYFSTRAGDKGPGLYVVPLASPGRSRRISSEVGESLRWEALPDESTPR